MDLCSLDHGLSWLHKREHCQFIQRLSVQQKNLTNFPIEKFPSQKISNQQLLPPSILLLSYKVFSHNQYPSHKDITKLSDRIIKKIQSISGPKKNWNSEEIVMLFWVSYYFQKLLDKEIHTFQNKNVNELMEIWNRISDFVPGRTGRQCMFKYLKMKRIPLSQCPWTIKQQHILTKLVSESSTVDWNWVSQELFFASEDYSTYRLPKQCREHWSSYSNSKLKKGPWRNNEDIILLSNILKRGRRWSELSKLLLGRTQNAIKNRANLLLNKDTKKFKSSTTDPIILQLIQAVKTNNSQSSILSASLLPPATFYSSPKNGSINLTQTDTNNNDTSSWVKHQDSVNPSSRYNIHTSYSFQPSIIQSCAAYNLYNPSKQLLQGEEPNQIVQFSPKEIPLIDLFGLERRDSACFDLGFYQNLFDGEGFALNEIMKVEGVKIEEIGEGEAAEDDLEVFCSK